MATDRLTLAHALGEGGIAREATEPISTEIFDVIHDNVASKTDLRELEQRLDLRFEKLKRQIDRMASFHAP